VSSDCGRSSGHLEPHLFEIQRPTAENRERADDVQHDERRDRDAIAAGQVKNPARGDWTVRGAEGEEHPGDAHYRAEAPDADRLDYDQRILHPEGAGAETARENVRRECEGGVTRPTTPTFRAHTE
jgi:hypothetical protein